MNKADLRGANLSALMIGRDRSIPVMLVESSLRFARLEGAELDGARLDGADVPGARTDAASFSEDQRRMIAARVDAAA